jgi:hypothetical protein
MYDLIQVRDLFTVRATFSSIYSYDGASHLFLCHALEDVARPAGVKIPEETAIPPGDYMVGITFSNRFKKLMPIIYNSDNYEIIDGANKWTGVRYHPGNTEAETEGCPLPGMRHDKKHIYDSRVAFNEHLFPYIESHPALKQQGYIRLRIINAQHGWKLD